MALLMERADWTDRLAAMVGVDPPPLARQDFFERWSFAPDVAVEETNVVELAAFVERVNRSL